MSPDPKAADDVASPAAAPERGFEQALKELEQRVQKLESGELQLEEALRLFEEGVGLVRECHDRLDDADGRIAALTRTPAGITETDLGSEGKE